MPSASGAASNAQPNDLLVLFQQYGALVLQALNGGMPGYDFADHITELTGNATHAMISAHGEDALVHTMLSIPEIALFGEQRLRSFTKEFINFEQYLEQASQENESPAGSEHDSIRRKPAAVV
jgi:hypothetical protein